MPRNFNFAAYNCILQNKLNLPLIIIIKNAIVA